MQRVCRGVPEMGQENRSPASPIKFSNFHRLIRCHSLGPIFPKVGIESVLPLINLGCYVAEIGSVAKHRIHLGWDAV